MLKIYPFLLAIIAETTALDTDIQQMPSAGVLSEKSCLSLHNCTTCDSLQVDVYLSRQSLTVPSRLMLLLLPITARTILSGWFV